MAMLRSLPFCLALALAAASPARAQVAGILPAGTTTWSSNTTMTGDVTVPVGGTLVINAGVTVTAATTDSMGSGNSTTQVELIVLGTCLSHKGTWNDPLLLSFGVQGQHYLGR